MPYRTLTGIDKVEFEVITPIPKQFIAEGTLTWGVNNLQSEKYDAIIVLNFLIPFKVKINMSEKYIDIF